MDSISPTATTGREVIPTSALRLLEEQLLPKVNLFCYGQVESAYGSGEFLRELDENFDSAENLVTSKIQNKDDIYASIKDFLGKGK